MPTSREAVTNRQLSGEELRTILQNDFQRLLENEGMLSAGMGFGRVGYEIQLTLHLDNYMVPQSKSHILSRPIAHNIVEGGAMDPLTKEIAPAQPELGAIETFPLTEPSPDATMGSLRLARNIDSPNEERLRNDMAIPVLVQQQDGTKTTEQIKYPKEEMGDGKVVIEDTTRAKERELGISSALQMDSVATAQNAGSDLCKCGYIRDNHSLAGICTQPQKEGHPECKGFVRHDAPDAPEESWPVEP